MDNLGALHVFAKLCELRSFTAVGAYFGVSTSAVSKTMGRLEKRLGVRLVQRSTRMVTLTHEGEVFLERCRSILRELEAAEDEISQSRGTPRGRLRVTVPSIGAAFLSGLAEFSATFSEIDLDIDFSDRIVDLIDEGYDVAVRAGSQPDSGMISRKIGYYRQVAVASPRYLEDRGSPVNLEDLAEHSCVLYRFPSTGKISKWPMAVKGRTIDIALRQTVVVNSLSPQISFAENGRGVACLPDVSIRQQLATGALVRVLDQYVAGTVDVCLVWPSSRNLSPKLRTFIDFAASNLAGSFNQD